MTNRRSATPASLLTTHLDRRQLLLGLPATGALLALGRSGSLHAAPPSPRPTSPAGPATPAIRAKSITLKLASVAPPGTPWSEQLKRMETRIDTRVADQVLIKSYLGGALVDELATLKRCQQGSIALWGGTSGAVGTLIPEIAALELPYLFPDSESADAILDIHALPTLEALLERFGFKLLFYSENGHRSIGTNFGFIKKPADLLAKKIRSQPSEVHLNTWKALGAAAVPIPVTETLTSLQSGVVNGFDNTELFTFAASWYQAITHFTYTRHCYQPGFVLASKKVWDDLPKAVQESFLADRQGDSKYGRDLVRALTPALRENFAAAKIQTYEPSKEELAAFRKATAKTHDQFRKKFGKELLNVIKKQL